MSFMSYKQSTHLGSREDWWLAFEINCELKVKVQVIKPSAGLILERLKLLEHPRNYSEMTPE